MERADAWLDGQKASRDLTLAIAHAPFIRTAFVLSIEARSFWRVDVAPFLLARLYQLSPYQGRWTLGSLGAAGEDQFARPLPLQTAWAPTL